MAKRGSVSSSLGGLRSIAQALYAFKGGRVDLGFFAGEAARAPEGKSKAAARAARVAKYTGEGSKPGFYKQGVDFSKKRAQVRNIAPEMGLTNPEVAAKNELGLGVPKRSMLRMPLHLHGDKVLKDAQEDVRAQLKTVGKNPQLAAKKMLDRLGIAGENLVQEAFATGGFGSWKPNAPLTVELKGSAAPLIDSSQLRHAVDSRTVF